MLPKIVHQIAAYRSSGKTRCCNTTELPLSGRCGHGGRDIGAVIQVLREEQRPASSTLRIFKRPNSPTLKGRSQRRTLPPPSGVIVGDSSR